MNSCHVILVITTYSLIPLIPQAQQGPIQEFAKGGRSLPFPFLPLYSPFHLSLFPLHLEVGPLKPAKWSGESFPGNVRGEDPTENEFGAL